MKFINRRILSVMPHLPKMEISWIKSTFFMVSLLFNPNKMWFNYAIFLLQEKFLSLSSSTINNNIRLMRTACLNMTHVVFAMTVTTVRQFGNVICLIVDWTRMPQLLSTNTQLATTILKDVSRMKKGVVWTGLLNVVNSFKIIFRVEFKNVKLFLRWETSETSN